MGPKGLPAGPAALGNLLPLSVFYFSFLFFSRTI
uniref:Uncharacterized protein n=1 Tax=Anguilla anguilla TaxID=7936 RepID=A0A0E9XSA9_ANGAN